MYSFSNILISSTFILILVFEDYITWHNNCYVFLIQHDCNLFDLIFFPDTPDSKTSIFKDDVFQKQEFVFCCVSNGLRDYSYRLNIAWIFI